LQLSGPSTKPRAANANAVIIFVKLNISNDQNTDQASVSVSVSVSEVISTLISWL